MEYEDKQRRALWAIAVGAAGFLLDRAVVIDVTRGAHYDPSAFDGAFFVFRGLFRFCLAFGFIAYLSTWKYVSKIDTIPLLTVRRIIFPFVTAIAPIHSTLKLLPREYFANRYFPQLSISTLLSLFLLIGVLSLSSKAFKEMISGSDNLRTEVSRNYARMLFSKVPPEDRSDIWLLDVLMVCVIAIVMFVL